MDDLERESASLSCPQPRESSCLVSISGYVLLIPIQRSRGRIVLLLRKRRKKIVAVTLILYETFDVTRFERRAFWRQVGAIEIRTFPGSSRLWMETRQQWRCISPSII